MASASRRALTLIFLMISMSWLTLVSGADIDGDGVDDSVDNCIYAAGNSTVDRTGCPDRDGDGTSDFNDGWTSSNPNFAKDVAITQYIIPTANFSNETASLLNQDNACSDIPGMQPSLPKAIEPTSSHVC